MELFGTIVIIAVVALSAAALFVWLRRRRAAFRAELRRHGWELISHGDATDVIPVDGAWRLTATRSFAAQQSPSTHIVTSVWAVPTPSMPDGVLVVGPAPGSELSSQASALLESMPSAMTRWLGIDQVGGGKPLKRMHGVDDRVLAFTTEEDRAPHPELGRLADAVGDWCADHGSEREQPVVVVDGSGLRVRVRIDVLRSIKDLNAFIDLGTRCRATFDGQRR